MLATPGNRLNANIVTASDDGIHWNAVRQAAVIIKSVGARSPHGQGNFNFAAIAMLKPYRTVLSRRLASQGRAAQLPPSDSKPLTW